MAKRSVPKTTMATFVNKPKAVAKPKAKTVAVGSGLGWGNRGQTKAKSGVRPTTRPKLTTGTRPVKGDRPPRPPRPGSSAASASKPKSGGAMMIELANSAMDGTLRRGKGVLAKPSAKVMRAKARAKAKADRWSKPTGKF